MEALIAKTRNYSNPEILAAVRTIGGGMVSVEMRMVRAALIEVYAERNGANAADDLMTELGM